MPSKRIRRGPEAQKRWEEVQGREEALRPRRGSEARKRFEKRPEAEAQKRLFWDLGPVAGPVSFHSHAILPADRLLPFIEKSSASN